MFYTLQQILYNTFLQASGLPPSWNLEDISVFLTYIVMVILFIAMLKFVFFFFTLPSKLL
jgi:hypothetical protein